MNSIQKQVKVVLSPSREQYSQIRAEYFAQTGSNSYYDNSELFDSLVKSVQKEWVLNDITFKQAQVFAEPIRIAHPTQCVSLYNEETDSFIGNTSWNDQVSKFWEYPVYTEEGARIMLTRKDVAQENGESETPSTSSRITTLNFPW
jgi:hypothetical protein